MCQKNNNISQKIALINDSIRAACDQISGNPNEIKLMAVTKNTSTQCVNEAISCGINCIGENRVQEFLGKVDQYNIKKSDIHFIGHLQTNKVKYIIDKVGMIESVDCIKLAQQIDRLCLLNGTTMPVLLQVNIANEQTKFGFTKEGVLSAIEQVRNLENIKVLGLMCVPPKENYISAFKDMQQLFLSIKQGDNIKMEYLSMGMSQNYVDAVLYGSNIIRLGSALFS